MLDHMIFNKLKWWNVDDNAESIQIGNRRFLAMPSEIIIKDGADLSRYDDTETALVGGDTTVKVIGVSKNAYIITGYVHFRGTTNLYSITFDEKAPAIIYANEVKKVIWGGKALLNALISGLYATIRKKVIA